jgi:hypothetical protein
VARVPIPRYPSILNGLALLCFFFTLGWELLGAKGFAKRHVRDACSNGFILPDCIINRIYNIVLIMTNLERAFVFPLLLSLVDFGFTYPMKRR